jgi:hypothetical protein
VLAQCNSAVVDHIPENSEYYYESDWIDPDYANEHGGVDPEPEEIIAGEVAVYSLGSPYDMLALASEFLPRTLPGVEVTQQSWDVE